MKKWWARIVIFFCLNLTVLYGQGGIRFTVPVYTRVSNIGERILMIAPHPDDETLAGAGVIQKAIRAGHSVKIVIITNGDGFRAAVRTHFGISQPKPDDYQLLGYVRQQETLRALAQLGVGPDDVIFLGYPDGGIHTLWKKSWLSNQLHVGLTGSDHSPYPFSYQRRAPYCGENLARNLSTIVRNYHPSDIIYPDTHDRHQDHWATSAFVKYVLAKDSYAGREWTYIVHRGNFPHPWFYRPELAMIPPAELKNSDPQWHYFQISPEEQARKFQAIQEHQTQTRVMRNFLYAFVRRNELFGIYTDPYVTPNKKELNFRDPTSGTGDRDRSKVLPGSDIVGYAVFETDQSICLGIELKDGVHPGIRYQFQLRLINEEGLKQMEIIADRQQTLRILFDGKFNKKFTENSSVILDGKKLWVEIPRELETSYRGIMISTETYYGRKLLNRSPWRYMKFTHLSNRSTKK